MPCSGCSALHGVNPNFLRKLLLHCYELVLATEIEIASKRPLGTEAASRVVLRKSCSENMQQICRKTPMPKCDFYKVTLQLC